MNIVERALILAEPGEVIGLPHLRDGLQEPTLPGNGGLSDSREQFERERIEQTLAQHGGNKTHAARELRMTYRGLHKKMQRLGMVEFDPARD